MKYAGIDWNNGTPVSRQFDDVYFSEKGGLEETEHVFLHNNSLPERWQGCDHFVIAETGFGTGLNFLVTMNAWLRVCSDNACLHYISIENNPVSPGDIRKLIDLYPQLQSSCNELLQNYPPPVPGMHFSSFAGGMVRLHLIFDDIERALSNISFKVDAWYLDGFAPASNPDMWNDRVFELIEHNSKVGTSFATYTASGDVRRGLSSAGFIVQKARVFGAKRDMLKGFVIELRCFADKKPWYRLPVPSFKQKQAVIIGAGLAGLATAWSLVQRGWKVTLIDRHAAVASGASGNPAGLLMPRLDQSPSADVRFYINAYIHAVHLLDTLQQSSDKQFWFKTGSLLLDDAEKLQQLVKADHLSGELFEFVDAEQTSEVCGVNINQEAMLLKDSGWVNVERLCHHMKSVCADKLDYVHADITRITHTTEGWRLFCNEQQIATSECLVLANGVHSNSYDQTQWMPVSSVRGQVSYVRATTKSKSLKCPVSGNRYMTPANNGLNVIGASYIADDVSSDLSPSEHADNINMINRHLPGIVQLADVCSGRVAFRAVSTDRVPIVGSVPDEDTYMNDYHDLHHGKTNKYYPPGTYLPGLYVTTAHGSRGLCSCLISGEIVASLICAEPMPVEKEIMDYLNPARFIIRKLKRNLC